MTPNRVVTSTNVANLIKKNMAVIKKNTQLYSKA